MEKTLVALSTIGISLLLLTSATANIPIHSTSNKKTFKLSISSNESSIHVGKSGLNNFSSIQEAINTAHAGDTIYIHSGVYNEHLILSKPVTIIGESVNTTVIDGSFTGSTTLINASGVILRNLHFRNAGGKMKDALVNIQKNNTHIQSCVFSYARSAILADKIENVTIKDCYFCHISSGIRSQSSFHINCMNCTFTKNGFGVLAKQSDYLSITHSYGRFNGVNYMIIHSNNINITNCVVCKSNENQGGIYVEFSQNINIKNCNVYHNGFGIRLLTCNYSLINKSSIYDCKLGVQISDTAQNTVVNSNIYGCDFGIYLDSSKRVDIHHNNIYDNYVGGLASAHSFANARYNWWGSPFGVLGNMFFRGGWVSIFPPEWTPINNKSYKPPLQHASYTQVMSPSFDFPQEQDVDNDTDDDGIPNWWEEQYGYDPQDWDNHTSLDPDKDGLNNVEEYLTYEWGSNPFKKDIFIEVDVMDPSYKLDEQQKQKMISRFAEHNISLHIDDGWMGGGEVIEKHDYVNYATLSNLYWRYFLHNDPLNWRKGVFRYVILSDSLFKNYPGFVFIGWDDADSFALSMGYYKNHTPGLLRDRVLVRVFMHELGHTLGLFNEVFPGIDNQSCVFPFIKGRVIYRNYQSCMNYQYAWRILDYSDGSQGKNDFDDWSHLDLKFFQNSHWQ